MMNKTKNSNSGALVASEEKGSLKGIVSEIKTDEKALRRAYLKERKMRRAKRKKVNKIRPLPSINVMRKRLMIFFVKERNKTMSSLSSLMSQPHDLCEAITKLREENRLIKEFPYKDSDMIKSNYLKYFWHNHWVQNAKD